MMVDRVSTGNILYFEDDEEAAQLFVEFFEEQGYSVIHYEKFPENGIEDIKKRCRELPHAVLLDAMMPGVDGYQACRLLRDDYLGADIPVIFISGKVADEDILMAYDVGANEFLSKPVRLKELAIKLRQYIGLTQQKLQQQKQIESAHKMVFEAMATSSELGEILRFHEESYSASSFQSLAKLLLEAISKFSLKSSVMFFTNTTRYFSDDETDKPLERKILTAFKDQPRIFSWKNRTFFNYQSFSVLVRNMPVDDEARYGVLKDQLCILLNGVEARVKSLLIEESNKKKAITLKIAADTIANMVMEIENDNVELSQKFEEVILKMEANISSDIIQFNLLEEEEKVLLEHIVLATKESSRIFDTSLEKEREYKEIMTKLLNELLSNV